MTAAGLRRASRIAPWLLLAAVAALFGRRLFEADDRPHAAGARPPGRCEAPAPGPPGRSTHATRSGLAVSVITPADYVPDARYGLLVLFPPAGFSRTAAERFYGVTAEATGAGFVVALSDALPLSRRAIQVQSEVAEAVRARWCIDPGRMVFAGHSDGGALAQGVVLRAGPGGIRPAAVLSSAAGIRAEDLAAETCPSPLSITILHSAADERFPGYGAGVARWWAQCQACGPLPPAAGVAGCVEAPRCADDVSVRHCEGAEAHSQRPPLFAGALRALLERAPAPDPNP